MSGTKDGLVGVSDQASGIAKRAVGELTARPDLVLEGEAQKAEGRAATAAAEPEASAQSGTVLGWKLDAAQRLQLIEMFPPRYAKTVADHVTLSINAPSHAPLPPTCIARIIGQVDDGAGVQAMVVTIYGNAQRPDGRIFHITWSLEPGRRASESNDVIALLGWEPLDEPITLALHAARF